MTRLGYQIPNFTYPDIGPAELFDAVARQAREAEDAGFDTVLVMDHFYQLPLLGRPEQYMLECYALLAGLAAATSTARLSALVTGNTYRNVMHMLEEGKAGNTLALDIGLTRTFLPTIKGEIPLVVPVPVP